MKKPFQKIQCCIIMILFSASLVITHNSCKKDGNAEPANPPVSKIIYTDIYPDTLIHSSTSQGGFMLDLDKDGVMDFEFTMDLTFSICNTEFQFNQVVFNLSVKPSNADGAIMNDGTSQAYALDSAVSIVPDSLWGNNSQVLIIGARGSARCVASFHARGHWSNAADKFLGLKIKKGNKTYYGWARITCTYTYFPYPYSPNVRGQLLVKDYAYNSTPNQPILAGQKK